MTLVLGRALRHRIAISFTAQRKETIQRLLILARLPVVAFNNFNWVNFDLLITLGPFPQQLCDSSGDFWKGLVFTSTHLISSWLAADPHPPNLNRHNDGSSTLNLILCQIIMSKSLW
jgi:hypothetical protein